jgi:ABC-type histidine transport system ATPase subunit
MSDGKIIEQGDPDQLFANPQTDKLKEYLVEGN